MKRIYRFLFILVLSILFLSPIYSFAATNDGEPQEGPIYAVIHYLRVDDDYGDHSTGDYNDFWGLHLWGDIEESIEWTAPKPFLGEDEYGRFSWVKLSSGASNVGFIVHQGDTRDGTNEDRFFDPSGNPEIWLRNNDETTYASQAEAQGFVTIHYRRDDGDYGDPTSNDYNDFWGLHLWGDAIDPSEETEWAMPKKPTGLDDYGAFWDIPINDATQEVNFIVHRGEEGDPGVDRGFVPVEDATVWLKSGDEKIYPQRGAAENFAVLHYHRQDGDYGDFTSPDFNDFWGLHIWTGALNQNTAWEDPLRPYAIDNFGPVFKIDLLDGAKELAYIIHRGDEKDPGADQFLDFGIYGYEVWQLQGADIERPYVLPIPDALNPQDAIDEIANEIENLVADGDLNPGQGNALLSILYNAAKKLGQGNTTAVINMLEAFIHKVNAFIRGEILTSEEGQSLIDGIVEIIDVINT